MSHIQQLNINLEGIGSILKSRRFVVPAYQRSYAWESDHVEALLDDIKDAINNNEKEYFLGSIVVTKSDGGRYEVVDGQQRLTTVSLIVSAIKEIFRDQEDEEVVQSIQKDFLSNTDRRTKEKEPKLVLNEIDNEIFQEIIDSYSNLEGKVFKKLSHKKLIDASRFCFSFLTNMAATERDFEESLHTWLDYIESSLKVILVTAPDDSNAFVIFETLNDRGLELATSDLVKNYLFHKSAGKLEETKNRWLTMVAVLEATTEEPLIVTYIRHLIMARYGLVREKDLFSFIKTKIIGQKAALKFSSELADTARTYSALMNTDHEFWADYDWEAKKAVATLNLLGMTQIRPLLLAILSKFSKREALQTLKKLVSTAIRYQIVGGAGGGTLEKSYAETAKAITEEKVISSSEVIQSLKNVPGDSAFKAAFEIATVSKSKIARFYLAELDAASNGGVEKVANSDVNKVNLEHILPQTPDEYWGKLFSKDDVNEMVNRLGNLAIIASKANSEVGNMPFYDKKNIYASSEFILTKEISSFQSWTKEDIQTRQKRMADIAVKHWSL